MKALHIELSFPGGRRVAAEVGGHQILTDQALGDGGEDQAPNPFELFLVSLATCSGYFALEFFRSRKLATRGLGLTLETDVDATGHRVERARIVVALPADFPDKYRGPLARAIDLCTVKRHLLEPPAIDLQFAPQPS